MAVVEPGSTRQGENRGSVVDRHSTELHRSRSEESVPTKQISRSAITMIGRGVPGPSIGQLTTERIQHRSKQYSVRQSDVDEERRVEFVDTRVQNVGDDNRGRWCSQGLASHAVRGQIYSE